MQAATRPKHSPNATFQIVAEEAILIHINTGIYYSLNDVGTSFWNLMDGQRTIADCAQAIATEYQAPPETVLADLLELAGELAAEDLALA